MLLMSDDEKIVKICRNKSIEMSLAMSHKSRIQWAILRIYIIKLSTPPIFTFEHCEIKRVLCDVLALFSWYCRVWRGDALDFLLSSNDDVSLSALASLDDDDDDASV